MYSFDDDNTRHGLLYDFESTAQIHSIELSFVFIVFSVFSSQLNVLVLALHKTLSDSDQWTAYLMFANVKCDAIIVILSINFFYVLFLLWLCVACVYIISNIHFTEFIRAIDWLRLWLIDEYVVIGIVVVVICTVASKWFLLSDTDDGDLSSLTFVCFIKWNALKSP